MASAVQRINSHGIDSDAYALLRAYKNKHGELPQLHAHSKLQRTITEVNGNTKLTQNIYNLLGNNGILPESDREWLLELMQDKADALADFIDLFQQRLITTSFNSWVNSSPLLSQETKRCELAKLNKTLAQQSTTQQHDYTRYYSGLLSNKQRSSSALAQIIQDYFKLPTTVHEFKGRWHTLPQSAWSTLGKQNNTLGSSAAIGKQLYYSQNYFNVSLGPISYQKLTQLLPNKPVLRHMSSLINNYAGTQFDFNITVEVLNSTIKHCRLQQQAEHFLGWNAWLKPSARSATTNSNITLYNNPINKEQS